MIKQKWKTGNQKTAPVWADVVDPPKQLEVFLISATLSSRVKDLSGGLMHEFEEIGFEESTKTNRYDQEITDLSQVIPATIK
jgi:ATP-dependent RNA helicase DDX31/DBP7